MRKSDIPCKICSCILIFLLCTLTGCSKESSSFNDKQSMKMQESEEITQMKGASTEEKTQNGGASTERITQIEGALTKVITQTEESSAEGTMRTDATSTEEIAPTEEFSTTDKAQNEAPEPIVSEVDISNYFDEINGAAVIYDQAENYYQIYNHELALTKRSPCSTFKIISSLIALENGIIKPDDSTRTWSGEVFWNEDWNRDIDFSDAFHASCVWYFREIVDEIGKDMIQEELNRLEYGNCDISDWDGRLNTIIVIRL